MSSGVGFSTGSLAGGDFRHAVDVLNRTTARAIELSALREPEFLPLLEEVRTLDLSKYDHVAIHVPSSLQRFGEREIVQSLRQFLQPHHFIVVHADIIKEPGLWNEFGHRLCVENMDKRKATGRTVDELSVLMESMRSASICLDIAHARQVDPTLSETVGFLTEFRGRIGQLHVSELNCASKHDRLSFAGVAALESIRDLIPAGTPVILEFSAEPHELEAHLKLIANILHPVAPALRRQVG